MKINVITGKPNAGQYQGRAYGTSTGIALACIAEAILSPGKEVRLEDHHPTPGANRYLFDTTADIVRKLGLRGIGLTRHPRLGVRFDLFQESDEYVEVDGKIYKRDRDCDVRFI